MELQEDRVRLSGLSPEQIKRKLKSYEESGGDTALLGHFILASSYWYREYNKMKLYIPISLLAGTLIGFYIGSP